MSINVGNNDRFIRLLLAAGGAFYLFSQNLSGTMQWVVGIFSLVMAATGLLGTCPIYSLLGFNTCPLKKF